MKTSRIARQTNHVVNSLFPGPRTSTRRSLRRPATAELNPPPPMSSKTKDDDAVTSTASSLGKRKRSHSTTSIITENTPKRHSPRKGIKQDPDASESKRKPPRRPAKRIQGPDGTVTVQPPTNWEEVYNITAEMRKRVLAPVDTMGCESLAEEHRSPRDRRLQTLIALMLSSQTKDTVTAVAMKNLQENLPGGFCLESLLKVDTEQLNNLINKVGFHNKKAVFIKSVAEILHDSFNFDIPDTIEGLVSLPGVGPKMAYLCMSAAWGRDEGIGVDVHVHRITNLWRWHKTSTPEQTRVELESWLPKEKWHAINSLLVGLGQTICLPVGRRCGECELGRLRLCPSVVASPAKRKVKKEMQIKAEGGFEVKKELQLTLETGIEVKEEEVVAEMDVAVVKIEIETKEEEHIAVEAGL